MSKFVIATVDAAGVVHAVGVGTTTITFSGLPGQPASAAVTVN